MTIIKTTTEDKKQLYFMTLAPNIEKMSNQIDEILVTDFTIFEDVNSKEETNTILSILDGHTGIAKATNSETFRKEFLKLVEIFGEKNFKIQVLTGMSKSNRPFIQPIFVDYAE